MLQWVTAISFSLGILLANYVGLSWSWLLAFLAFGFSILVFQHRRKGNPWIALIWNVVVAGMIWTTLRMEMRQQSENEGSPTFVERIPQNVSQYARDCLLRSGIEEDNVIVLNAMLLGNRKPLSQEQKLRFRNAGAQHLLALSGLHLGIFIAVLSFLYLRKARYSRWRWPVLFCTLALLWGYCLIAGMPQSLLRAMLMTTLFYFGLFSTSRTHSSITLANTLLLMLLIDPMSLFDIGTQLSFAAVGAIIWLCPVISNILPVYFFPKNKVGGSLHWLWQLFAVSLSAWFGTMPLCLYYFHQFQPWQPLVSIALIPLTTVLLYVALILLLLAMSGIWLLAAPFAFVTKWLMLFENTLLVKAGSLPGSTILSPAIHVGHVLLLYSLFFILGIGIQGTRKVQYYCLFEMLLVIVLLCVV